jgi:transcription elongation factor SPT5
VRPGVEEVQAFAKLIENTSTSGLVSKRGHKDDSSGDEAITAEELIKKTFVMPGSQTEICKGDKIRVIKGDLTGINGQVLSVESDTGFIIFKPNFEGLDQDLRIEASNVVKYFEAGDHVRVIDGKYRAEVGIVVSSETNDKGIAFSNIVLAQSNKEIKIFSNNLKLKTEIE